MAERRGTKVLVDSRWRLQISLPGCAGTPRSADYLPDMSPRFWLWLHKTHAGRNVFLIGQSRAWRFIARFQLTAPYVRSMPDGAGVCGRRCAAGIVFWFSTSDLGASFLMPAITAVVLGGAIFMVVPVPLSAPPLRFY